MAGGQRGQIQEVRNVSCTIKFTLTSQSLWHDAKVLHTSVDAAVDAANAWPLFYRRVNVAACMSEKDQYCYRQYQPCVFFCLGPVLNLKVGLSKCVTARQKSRQTRRTPNFSEPAPKLSLHHFVSKNSQKALSTECKLFDFIFFHKLWFL